MGTSEKLAALIWRFIGVFLLVSVIPAGVLSLGRLVWFASNGRIGLHQPGALFPLLLFVVQVVAGVLIFRFSKRLGKLIARDL
jgi:hypothetical protein